jgi:hypothetical protein
MNDDEQDFDADEMKVLITAAVLGVLFTSLLLLGVICGAN